MTPLIIFIGEARMLDYENLAKANEFFFDDYKKVFEEILREGWYILGRKVSEFETEFAKYLGTKYCIGVASGLDALVLSLKYYDFKLGSEVIVPSNTYIATIFSILQCGLKPVLVEPDLATYNIDPLKIKEKINSKTVAIMIVHLYGKACSMDSIMSLSKTHNLVLIEDCAQAHGAKYKERLVGTFGDCNAFSFYPTKNLGAIGDAGAVVTDNLPVAEKIRKLRNYGSNVKYHNDYVGYNSRLDEIQAGFLLAKLKKIDIITTHKRNLAQIYLRELKEDFVKPIVQKDCYDVYHIFNVRHPARDRLKDYLLKNGIKTEIHYPIAPHKQKALAGVVDDYNYPISEEIHETTLSLPISFLHTEDDVRQVVKVMNRF
jgi:dTDP-4-amino-4,6-dideoxygalactose transaminase